MSNPNMQKIGKRKTPGGQKQPDWLFPSKEQAASTPKTEHQDQPKKKNDKQLAKDLLKRRAAGEHPKSAALPQLLKLVSAFLAEYEFTNAAQAFETERKSRGEIAESLEDIPSLESIYHEWRGLKDQNKTLGADIGAAKINSAKKQKSSEQKVDASSSGSDSSSEESIESSDIEMGDAPASDSSSDSSSSSDSDADDEEEVPVKVRSPKAKVNGLKRKAALSSGSSTGSDSSSDEEAPKPKKLKTKVTSNSSDADSSSESSSSNSSSDSSSDASPKKMKYLTMKESSSESETSSSESSSDSDSSTNSTAQKVPLPESDSDSSSSSDSESSEEDAKKKPVVGSDTSATLSDAPKKTTASDDSSSDSSSDSEAESKPAKATIAERKLSPPLPPDPVSQGPKGKVNKRFSRIPEDIKVDERLASNAYMPYDYAQKAHEDLIVTKGKGFTKEKNKKKRGSYKGGYIDVEGKKGIKFED